MGLQRLALEGLDGSGKGTTLEELTKILLEMGYNVLAIDFPQYTAPWGRAIKKSLRNGSSELALEDKMAMFALNRLEAVGAIQQAIAKFDGETVVVFDRFPTSNIITIAYYLASNDLKGMDFAKAKQWMLKNIDQITYYISMIYEIDCAFIRALELEETKVFIPAIDPKISIARISSDTTREETDTYEVLEVQQLADFIYRLARKEGLLNLELVDQDGRDATTIAQDIVKRAGIKNGNTESPQSIYVRLDGNPSIPPAIQEEISKLLNQFPKLKSLQGVEQ